MDALLLGLAFALFAYNARGRLSALFPLGLLAVVAVDLLLSGHGLEDQPFRTRLVAATGGAAAGFAAQRHRRRGMRVARPG